jgi:hypothetical protein
LYTSLTEREFPNENFLQIPASVRVQLHRSIQRKPGIYISQYLKNRILQLCPDHIQFHSSFVLKKTTTTRFVFVVVWFLFKLMERDQTECNRNTSAQDLGE